MILITSKTANLPGRRNTRSGRPIPQPVLNGLRPRTDPLSALRRRLREPHPIRVQAGQVEPPAPGPRGDGPERSSALYPRHPARWGGFFGNLLPPSVKGAILGASMLWSVGALRTPSAEAKKERTPIVYLGLNPDVAHEVGELRRYTGASIDLIAPGPRADQITYRGATYDLAEDEGIRRFARALGLEGARAEAFLAAMGTVGEGARDEAAQLVLRLADAELGLRKVERLVISGHNLGTGPWGDGNGQLPWSALGGLVAVFPNAARQVEDLFVAACYSGGEAAMDEYQAMFPKLATIWAYDGSAPGAASGAAVHLARWERATRGHREPVDRQVALGTRKGEFVAVWTEGAGYQSGTPAVPLAQAEARYLQTADLVPLYLSGERKVEDPQQGPLRTHYARIQHLLGRRDLAPDTKARLSVERGQVARLLFFDRVKDLFLASYGGEIDRAHQSLGLAPPDLRRADRADSLVVIRRYQEVLSAQGHSTPEQERVQTLLTEGLRDLSPAWIPETWI